MPVDEVVSHDAVLWAARQVLRQHTEQPEQVGDTDPATGRLWQPSPHTAGRCAQCDGGDPNCRLLVWARAELAQQT